MSETENTKLVEVAKKAGLPKMMELAKLHDDLNKITWTGEDEGWNKAITAVQEHILKIFMGEIQKPKTPETTDQSERDLVDRSIRVRTEMAAVAIYRRFEGADEHPWSPGGNSNMQTLARDYARVAIETFGDYQKEEEYLKLHRENAAARMDAQLAWERSRLKSKEVMELQNELTGFKFPLANRIEVMFNEINSGLRGLPDPEFEENYRMSESKDLIVIGDTKYPGDGRRVGKVFIYRCIAGQWVKEKEIHASLAEVNGCFGTHIVMTEDGNTVVTYEYKTKVIQVWHWVNVWPVENEWRLSQKLSIKEIMEYRHPGINLDKFFVRTTIDQNNYAISFSGQTSSPSGKCSKEYRFLATITNDGLVDTRFD